MPCARRIQIDRAKSTPIMIANKPRGSRPRWARKIRMRDGTRFIFVTVQRVPFVLRPSSNRDKCRRDAVVLVRTKPRGRLMEMHPNETAGKNSSFPLSLCDRSRRCPLFRGFSILYCLIPRTKPSTLRGFIIL